MACSVLLASQTRTQIRKTRNSQTKSSHRRRFWLRNRRETSSRPILSISKTKLRSWSRTKRPLYRLSLTGKTRKLLSWRLRLRTKKSRTTTGMNNFLRTRRKWRGTTRTRSTKWWATMSRWWTTESLTTLTRWTRIIKDSMSFKIRRMTTPDASKRGSTSCLYIMRRSSKSWFKIKNCS